MTVYFFQRYFNNFNRKNLQETRSNENVRLSINLNFNLWMNFRHVDCRISWTSSFWLKMKKHGSPLADNVCMLNFPVNRLYTRSLYIFASFPISLIFDERPVQLIWWIFWILWLWSLFFALPNKHSSTQLLRSVYHYFNRQGRNGVFFLFSSTVQPIETYCARLVLGCRRFINPIF